MKSRMNLHRVILYALSLQLLLIMPDLRAQDQKTFVSGGRQVDPASINKEIEKMIDDLGIPGLSLAVVEGGKVVFAQSYGYREASKKQRVTTETVFEAASLTKPYLAYVAMQLVDEGKLDLDKPLCQYKELKRLDHDPRYRQITARMVLGHSSGIENWQHRNDPDVLELEADPGSRMVYSGEGYVYLSDIMEGILGQSYEQFITERILKPNNLTNTVLRYTDTSPLDYALPHDNFGREIFKYKNTDAGPASWTNVNATDYAKMLALLFDPKTFSAKTREEMLKPVVRVLEKDPHRMRALGFELIYGDRDTVANHQGHNGGFRSSFFYSPAKKRGFAFFTNHDRGWLLGKKLNELTANLDLSTHFDDYYEQYPSDAIDLLKVYRSQGTDGLFSWIDKAAASNRLRENTMLEVGELFIYEDTVLARKVLKRSIEKFPKSPGTEALFGDLNLRRGQYSTAYQYYMTAMSHNFDLWNMDRDVRTSKKETAKREAICATVNTLDENIVIEAENYCSMIGASVQSNDEAETGHSIKLMRSHWVDYNLNVMKSSSYKISVRLSSPAADNQLQVTNDGNLIATMNAGPTGDSKTWTTSVTDVVLQPGSHKLRIYVASGEATINWIKLVDATKAVSQQLK